MRELDPIPARVAFFYSSVLAPLDLNIFNHTYFMHLCAFIKMAVQGLLAYVVTTMLNYD